MFRVMFNPKPEWFLQMNKSMDGTRIMPNRSHYPIAQSDVFKTKEEAINQIKKCSGTYPHKEYFIQELINSEWVGEEKGSLINIPNHLIQS